jgi:hypothetical protein
MTKQERPNMGRPGHRWRVGPVGDPKQTELLWVRPERKDYELYAPATS